MERVLTAMMQYAEAASRLVDPLMMYSEWAVSTTRSVASSFAEVCCPRAGFSVAMSPRQTGVLVLSQPLAA